MTDIISRQEKGYPILTPDYPCFKKPKTTTNIMAKYLLELVNHVYDLFLSSELEERRQLVNLVLQNLKLDNKKLVYVAQKPFDMLLNCGDNKL
jgi:hypothetical protein